MQKGHVCIIGELLSGFGMVLALEVCVYVHMCSDLPLLAVLRAGSAGDELSLIICELFVTNYNQCS